MPLLSTLLAFLPHRAPFTTHFLSGYRSTVADQNQDFQDELEYSPHENDDVQEGWTGQILRDDPERNIAPWGFVSDRQREREVEGQEGGYLDLIRVNEDLSFVFRELVLEDGTIGYWDYGEGNVDPIVNGELLDTTTLRAELRKYKVSAEKESSEGESDRWSLVVEVEENGEESCEDNVTQGERAEEGGEEGEQKEWV
ncbi:hypothetical protein K469DRAFT_762103 [Zopfia rhizophila CBS 207.26]|uniref:Uncharacterized protein n=1 Tax=Zopfia rhizophila CBS 207.26 TaxID=1314779 RepID=A0A6A6EEW2_9PEZI|nr:hypothetical protein K469DRAFT_762103 [Zopfia rhizophila CBS 207.26]